MNVVTEIDNPVQVRHVLASVSDKRGLEELIPGIIEMNPDVKIYSTGGTFTKLAEILGADAEGRLIQVSDYTGQPETQGGLVKTLDFKIYLGLLTETYNQSHQADLARTQAVPIDMTVVNLYPFEQTVATPGVTFEEARGNIDIGGPCMLRASAKNFHRVAAVCNPESYDLILANMQKNGGATDLKMRFILAQQAFAHTAKYDLAISHFLEGQDPKLVMGAYPNVHDKFEQRGE
ncbi:MAG: hypothetical protein KKE20_02360 [Nanoarchaeota archaeon]|nr:hypothetical protein [Nanoarchaeota archaeon]